MIRQFIHRIKARKGQTGESGYAAVETALLLPLFLLILMGVIDFSRLYWTQSTVTSAAVEGARLAILADVSESEINTTIAKHLANGGVSDIPKIEIGPRVPLEPVSVRVSVNFDFITLIAVFADIFKIDAVTATSVMIHER